MVKMLKVIKPLRRFCVMFYDGPPMINMLGMNYGVDNLRKGVFIAAICYQQFVLIRANSD